MAGLSATAGSGFDYIQAAEPADPENAELWFDTDGGTDGNGEVKVYDGSQWDTTGYVSHDQLTNVSPGDHFSPGSGLSFSGGTLDLLLSGDLTIDGSGDLALSFDPATQTDLDSHAGDTSNPHNVTDDQTGAASALNNHANNSSAHHSRYSDSEARGAVRTVVASGETYIDSNVWAYQDLRSGTVYIGDEVDGDDSSIYTAEDEPVTVQFSKSSTGEKYATYEVIKFA